MCAAALASTNALNVVTPTTDSPSSTITVPPSESKVKSPELVSISLSPETPI